MKKTLKSESFAQTFYELNPQEVIRKCKLLTGAEDICSDVNNWKAYVSKRFSRKRAVQRPDLLTSEEWIAYATSLGDPNNIFLYVVRLNEHDLEGTLYNERPENEDYDYFEWSLFVHGIPFIRREAYRPAVFISDFQILNTDDLLEEIGDELWSFYNDVNFLESSELAVERHVEILTDVLPKAIALHDDPFEIEISVVSGDPSRRSYNTRRFVSVETTIALLKQMSNISNGSMSIRFNEVDDITLYINWWPVRL